MSRSSESDGAIAFELDRLQGRVAAEARPPDLELALGQALDPAAADEMLHWGRNILWRVGWPAAGGSFDVVVKQYRHEGWRRRLDRRWRGSKAARNWRRAVAIARAGIPTPEPVAWVESRAEEGPAYFVCRHLPDRLEARYPLRALNAGELEARFPGLGRDDLLGALADTARHLHREGFWHRDFSAGNVLFPPLPWSDDVVGVVVDLNRARRPRRLRLGHRLSDLARLPIERTVDRATLLERYFGRRPTLIERLTYGRHHRLFHGKHRAKKWIRARTAGVRGLLFPRKAYPHLPPPEAAASRRDRAVWDRLSDQPHQHASRWDKLAVRVGDVGAHGRTLWAVATSTPRIWRRYRGLRAGLYQEPVPFEGIGVCVRPLPGHEEELLASVEALGAHHVLLRLHPWEADHAAEEALARCLVEAGHEVVFALPQRRELVRDLGRWRASLEEIADRFSPFGRAFQIGQAINRSKWGVWNYREFQSLAEVASEVLRRRPEVEIVGPGVIDFELHATAAVVNWPGSGVRFDALASLLYVDRRGAPENRQAGFDTVDKVVLAKAIADTAHCCAPRSWITEVNWPLREGPHSPAGRHVSVDEEAYADYLARYYLLALATGCVERVYWWQLVARGYGLAVLRDDGIHHRPGFRALATLKAQLGGTTFCRPLTAAEGVRLYHFRRPGGVDVVAGWSTTGRCEVDLPGPVAGAVDRDGEDLPASGPKVRIDGAPRYFELEPGAELS